DVESIRLRPRRLSRLRLIFGAPARHPDRQESVICPFYIRAGPGPSGRPSGSFSPSVGPRPGNDPAIYFDVLGLLLADELSFDLRAGLRGRGIAQTVESEDNDGSLAPGHVHDSVPALARALAHSGGHRAGPAVRRHRLGHSH